MSQASVLIIILLSLMNNACVRREPQPTVAMATSPTPTVTQTKIEGRPTTATGCKSPKEVAIDLCNHTYPGIWNKAPLMLKNGEEEYFRNHQFVHNELVDIELTDFTNDGKPEALVTINNISGGGSSCSMIHYYLFQLKNRQPILIWKFTTGCESSCGIKEFDIKEGKLYFELFGNCQVRKGVAKNVGGYFSDIETDTYTKLTFGYQQGKYQLVSRAVEPYEKRLIR
jgi:hypothetical protein